jgi:hypothetical protein
MYICSVMINIIWINLGDVCIDICFSDKFVSLFIVHIKGDIKLPNIRLLCIYPGFVTGLWGWKIVHYYTFVVYMPVCVNVNNPREEYLRTKTGYIQQWQTPVEGNSNKDRGKKVYAASQANR